MLVAGMRAWGGVGMWAARAPRGASELTTARRARADSPPGPADAGRAETGPGLTTTGPEGLCAGPIQCSGAAARAEAEWGRVDVTCGDCPLAAAAALRLTAAGWRVRVAWASGAAAGPAGLQGLVDARAWVGLPDTGAGPGRGGSGAWRGANHSRVGACGHSLRCSISRRAPTLKKMRECEYHFCIRWSNAHRKNTSIK